MTTIEGFYSELHMFAAANAPVMATTNRRVRLCWGDELNQEVDTNSSWSLWNNGQFGGVPEG